jgi:hypothetical protein
MPWVSSRPCSSPGSSASAPRRRSDRAATVHDAHAAALADPAAPEREAGERLARVHGAAELHAAILALLLPAGSRRPVRAWRLEVAGAPDAEALRLHASRLSGAAPPALVRAPAGAGGPAAARRPTGAAEVGTPGDGCSRCRPARRPAALGRDAACPGRGDVDRPEDRVQRRGRRVARVRRVRGRHLQRFPLAHGARARAATTSRPAPGTSRR